MSSPTLDPLTMPLDQAPFTPGEPALWLEMAVKYDVPEFGAEPLPLPTFENAPTTGAPTEE